MRPINPTLGSEPLRASRISSINTIGKSWDSVLFQQGKSVLDFDLNVQQRILKEQMSELARIFVTSGWNQSGELSYNFTDTSLVIPISRINVFGTFARIAQYNVNGGINDTSYPISLSGTSQGNAVFVWIEIWFQEIVPNGITEKIDGSTNSAIENKSSVVYGYGNSNAGSLSIDNETKDPVFGAETTRRIQIRWRLRQKKQNSSVYNKGFANVSNDGSITDTSPNILARGGRGDTSADGVAGYTFLRADKPNVLSGIDYNYYFTSETDRNFWIAGDGTAADALALNTVDGRVYAVPVCYIYGSDPNVTINDLRDLSTSVIPVWGVSFDSNPTGFSVSSGTVPKTLTINDNLEFTGSGGTNFIFPNTDGTLALQNGYLGNASAGNLTVTTINNLSLTPLTVGFKISGGTSTSKTLQINKNLIFDAIETDINGIITFPSSNGTVAFQGGAIGAATATSINGLNLSQGVDNFSISGGSGGQKTLTVGATLKFELASGGSGSGTNESIKFPSGNGEVLFKNTNISVLSVNNLKFEQTQNGFLIARDSSLSAKTLTINNTITMNVVDSGSSTITFPSGNKTIVDTDTSQTITNKNLVFGDGQTSNIFQDDQIPGRQMKFRLSSIDAPQIITLNIPNQNGTIALTKDLMTVGKVIALAMVFG